MESFKAVILEALIEAGKRRSKGEKRDMEKRISLRQTFQQ